MEALSFVKNFRNGDGWEQATLTEQESKSIQKQLRKINNQIYLECLRDAETMLKRYIMTNSNPLKQVQAIADKLFEKRAIHSLTAYQEFLKAKVEKLRNGEGDLNVEGR